MKIRAIKKGSALRSFLMIGCVALITAGCSSGGDSDDGGGGDQSSEVSGSAVKGIMSGATVEVFAIQNGAVSSSVLQTGTTQEDGTYTLQLDNYSGPVKVVLTATTDTVVTCDALSGCGSYSSENDSRDTNQNGDVDFGEKYTLGTDDDGLQLSAMLPSVTAGSNATVNLTPITSLAAAQAESGGSIDSDAISAANERVRRVLQLTGDIVSTTPPDITNLSETDQDNTSGIEIASLSAAIASLASESQSSLKDTLNTLTSDFVSNQGELKNNSVTDTLTLANLSGRAAQVIDRAEQTTGVELDNVQSKMTAIESIAQAEAPDSLTDTSDEDSSDNIATARALVQDVRTWYNLIEREGEGKADSFGDNLSAAQDALETTVDATMLGDDTLPDLFLALEAAFEVGRDRWNVSKEGVVEILAVDTSDLETSLDGDTVTVTGTVEGQTVNLELVFDATPNALNATQLDVDISGTIENGDATMTIAKSTDATHAISLIFDEGVNLTRLSDLDTDIYSSAVANLNIQIDEEGADSAAFVGEVSVSFNDGDSLETADISFDGTFSTDAGDSFEGVVSLDGQFLPGESEEDSSNLDTLVASLTGELNTAGGESLEGDFSVSLESSKNASDELHVDAEGDAYINLTALSFVGTVADAEDQRYYTALSVDVDEQGDPPAQDVILDAEVTPEDGDNYYTVSATLTMLAEFTGWPAAYFQVNANRAIDEDDPEHATGTLTITWGGTVSDSDLDSTPTDPQRQLVVTLDSTKDSTDGDSNNVTFTATNNNTESTMTLTISCDPETEECEADKEEGQVTVDGEVVATIRYRSSIEAYTVDYNDGSFETL